MYINHNITTFDKITKQKIIIQYGNFGIEANFSLRYSENTVGGDYY